MANSTVLALTQSFCRTYALPVPTALQGSADGGAQQLRELLQQVGEELQGASDWQQLMRRVVWLSTNTISQGTLTARFPDNFDHIITETFWDNSARRKIAGPVGDVMWQAAQVLNPAGPMYAFRIAGDLIEILPKMPAGRSLSAIYKSKSWVLDSGGNPKLTYTLDTDTSCFSDKLMKAGLRAFWLRVKQMPHRLEMETFDTLKAAEASQGAAKPILSMDNEGASSFAGITIPIGSWTK